MKLAFDNDDCMDVYDHCMKKDERIKKIEQNFAFVINYEKLFGNYSSHPYTEPNISDIQYQKNSISSIGSNIGIRGAHFSLDNSNDDEEDDEKDDEEA